MTRESRQILFEMPGGGEIGFVTHPQLKLHVIVSEMFGENAYFAQLDGDSPCVVFDPGFDDSVILRFLDEQELVLSAIINTHGHIDHIAGNRALKERFPDCPLVIGAGDAEKLTDPVKNLSSMMGSDLTSPAADELVHEGDVYSAAGIDLEVIEVPGHSKGHVVFLWKGSEPWVAFVGDVLFQGGIGRTDFPDGDTDLLLSSIRSKLYTLPDDTLVLPGHGPSTTIGDEKRSNPFVRA
ncbi:MAG: MBL fold metallo-hydrolase [Pirellulaceae bacterium]